MEILEKISLYLLGIGMSALLLMILFVNTDIIARYFFSDPIAGSTELVAMLLVVVSFFSLPLCQLWKRNITITIILDILGDNVRLYVDAVFSTMNAAFTILIVWQTYEQGLSDLRGNAVTPIMVLPVSPFRFAAALATFWLFAVFSCDLAQSISRLKQRPRQKASLKSPSR